MHVDRLIKIFKILWEIILGIFTIFFRNLEFRKLVHDHQTMPRLKPMPVEIKFSSQAHIFK